MALWDRISSRGKVEDRRAMGPIAVGGLSAAGVALYLLITVLTGGEINVTDVLSQLENVQVPTQNYTQAEFEGEDSYEVFASTVLGSNNEMWQSTFSNLDQEYVEPALVLFRNATISSCGTATSQVGPHYCPLDQTIYLDETFFEELTNRFGAEGGDVAEAYVIAHEVGHHAQNLLGNMEKVHNADDNEASISLELQADCFAGLWAYSVRDVGVFQEGEIKEALDAAAAVGDDRIQERVTGYVNPESWTHGSSEQRVAWFTRGFESGNLSSCNTFN